MMTMAICQERPHHHPNVFELGEWYGDSEELPAKLCLLEVVKQAESEEGSLKLTIAFYVANPMTGRIKLDTWLWWSVVLMLHHNTSTNRLLSRFYLIRQFLVKLWGVAVVVVGGGVWYFASHPPHTTPSKLQTLTFGTLKFFLTFKMRTYKIFLTSQIFEVVVWAFHGIPYTTPPLWFKTAYFDPLPLAKHWKIILSAFWHFDQMFLSNFEVRWRGGVLSTCPPIGQTVKKNLFIGFRYFIKFPATLVESAYFDPPPSPSPTPIPTTQPPTHQPNSEIYIVIGFRHFIKFSVTLVQVHILTPTHLTSQIVGGNKIFKWI